MADIPYQLSNESVMVVWEGKSYTVQRGAPNFIALRRAIIDEKWDEVPQHLTVKKSVHAWARGNFSISEDEQVLYQGKPLPEGLNERIVQMVTQGDDPQSLLNFWEKLKKNPSWRSVKHLYPFLAHKGIPITPTGNLLAYKSVRHDLRDHHSGTVLNAIGSTIEMERNEISDDPSVPCHYGYHVGALEYARTFHQGEGQRILICEVDPADVVCVPYDEGHKKMRVCRYKVLGFHNGQHLPSTVFDPSEGANDAPPETLEGENERVVDKQADAEAAASGGAYVPAPTVEEEEEAAVDAAYDPENDMLAEECEECGYRVPPDELGAPGKWHSPDCKWYSELPKKKPELPPEQGRVVDLMHEEADVGVKVVPDAASLKAEADRKAATEAPRVREGKLPKRYEKYAKMDTVQLLELTIDELRDYAGKGLRIIGASKVPGGKSGLVSVILKVRK